tara:strand:- start:115 stop:522 length:408 start_codon:yes stop_codon:yes gene_type:complete
MLKGTKLYAITQSKCPHCMEGAIYPNKNPYNLKRFSEINERCSACNQNFEPEPNFYYGAMYVSYGYTVALFVAVYVILGIWMDWSMWPTITALGVILVLLGPLLFRIARTTWLSLFVHYDKTAIENWEKTQKEDK